MAGYSPDTIAANIFSAMDYLRATAGMKSDAADVSINAAMTRFDQQKPNKPETTAFPFTPVVLEPKVDIPEFAPGVQIANFQSYATQIIAAVTADFTDFFNTYFPDETAYLSDVDAWLTDVIVNGGTGLPVEIERQTYQRDKDRIEGEYQKAFSEAQNVWAARGFNQPTGTLTGIQFNLRQAADKSMAESSRAVAIKQAEIRLDQVKFAISTSIDKRAKAIQEAIDYMKALIAGYDVTTKMIVIQNDGQAKLIGAASEYYKARIAVEELKMKADAMEAEFKDKATARYQEQIMAILTQGAALSAESAKMMATQAAAALNALHTGASMNLGVSL